MCKLSFIIPVYNTGRYIKKCIDSICCQKIVDYEIIIIDDGSTDDSLQILQRYKDKTNILIYSQHNGGVSSARNRGLNVCKGEYIFFVDSDDFIEENSLPLIIDILNNESPELLKINSNIVINGNKKRNSVIKENQQKNIKKIYSNTDFCPALWGYVFKTRIIKSNKILFNENLRYSEDSNFIFKYLNHIKDIKFCNIIAYNYVIRNDSAIHQKITQTWAESNLTALIDILEYGNKNKFIVDYYLRSYFSLIQKAKLISSDKAIRGFKNYYSTIVKNAEGEISILAILSGKSYKLACILYSIVSYFYRFKSKFLN